MGQKRDFVDRPKRGPGRKTKKQGLPELPKQLKTGQFNFNQYYFNNLFNFKALIMTCYDNNINFARYAKYIVTQCLVTATYMIMITGEFGLG